MTMDDDGLHRSIVPIPFVKTNFWRSLAATRISFMIWVWWNCTYFDRIALGLKKGYGRTALG